MSVARIRRGRASFVGVGLATALLGVVLPHSAALAQDANTLLSEQVDLPRLVDLCAQRLKLNIQYDASQLQGALTLRLGAGISDDNLWVLTNRLLASRGFTTVQMAGEATLNVVKITEAAAVARVESPDLEGAVAGFAKVIVRTQHRAPDDLVPPIKQVLSPTGGTVAAVGRSNLLSISDLRPNLQQALDVLRLLDVPDEVITEEVVVDGDTASALIALIDSVVAARATLTGTPLKGKLVPGGGGAGGEKILLVAPPTERELWQDLIRRFSRPDDVKTITYAPPAGYPIKDVAKILEEMAKVPGAEKAEARWQLVTDELTRTLLVTATSLQQAKIAQFFERLKSAQSKNALIAEVPAQNVDPARLATLVEKVAATHASVQGRPLQGKLIPSPAGASLLLVSPPDEEVFWRGLIERLDQREPAETVTYSPKRFPLKEVAKLLESATRDLSPLPPGSDRWKLVTDELTGTLIVTASPSQHEKIAALLTRLETTLPAASRPMRSYVIRNRKASELAQLILELIGSGFFGGEGSPSAARAPMKNLQVSPRASEPAPGAPRSRTGSSPGSDAAAAETAHEESVTADEGTNTLIAIGEGEFLDHLEELIRKLDVRQSQVMLEVLVASMTDRQAFFLGAELQKQFSSADTLFGLASLFGGGSPSPSASTLPSATGTGFSGVVLDPGSFSVLVRALETLNEGRSLTMPKVLVNNNQEARLDSVLQTPFASTNASTTVATTSFGGTQDAGTTISVQPQIAEGDHLVLQYTVSISSFVGQSSVPELPPPRQQNNLSSRVTIPDGYTVVLGGLEIEANARSLSQVPLLGDIPLLGELFRSHTTTTEKTRFFVFIRADIMRGGESFSDLKYVSDIEASRSHVDDGWPEVSPRVMR